MSPMPPTGLTPVPVAEALPPLTLSEVSDSPEASEASEVSLAPATPGPASGSEAGAGGVTDSGALSDMHGHQGPASTASGMVDGALFHQTTDALQAQDTQDMPNSRPMSASLGPDQPPGLTVGGEGEELETEEGEAAVMVDLDLATDFTFYYNSEPAPLPKGKSSSETVKGQNMADSIGRGLALIHLDVLNAGSEDPHDWLPQRQLYTGIADSCPAGLQLDRSGFFKTVSESLDNNTAAFPGPPPAAEVADEAAEARETTESPDAGLRVKIMDPASWPAPRVTSEFTSGALQPAVGVEPELDQPLLAGTGSRLIRSRKGPAVSSASSSPRADQEAEASSVLPKQFAIEIVLRTHPRGKVDLPSLLIWLEMCMNQSLQECLLEHLLCAHSPALPTLPAPPTGLNGGSLSLADEGGLVGEVKEDKGLSAFASLSAPQHIPTRALSAGAAQDDAQGMHDGTVRESSLMLELLLQSLNVIFDVASGEGRVENLAMGEVRQTPAT